MLDRKEELFGFPTKLSFSVDFWMSQGHHRSRSGLSLFAPDGFPPTSSGIDSGPNEPQRESAGEAADNPKAVVVVAVVGIVPVAIRTATVPRIFVPRAAARLPAPITSLSWLDSAFSRPY
jgi:hypothetical protein